MTIRVLDEIQSAATAGIDTRASRVYPNFGTTAQRPTTTWVGYPYFDTTLGFAIWWNGTIWVNSAGADVEPT